MKYLDLSSNKFNEMCALKCPRLEYLDISHNRIEKASEGWQGHPNLKIFKSIENKFRNMKPFKDMPKLQELYLANNIIGTLLGCDGLISLKKLHLRHNSIKQIEEEGVGEQFPALEYLNLRTNKIAAMSEVYKLLQLPSLTSLNILNCPVELGYSSMTVLICQVLSHKPNPKITTFCKQPITDTNRLYATYYAEQQWQKEEEKRKIEEEK